MFDLKNELGKGAATGANLGIYATGNGGVAYDVMGVGAGAAPPLSSRILRQSDESGINTFRDLVYSQ